MERITAVHRPHGLPVPLPVGGHVLLTLHFNWLDPTQADVEQWEWRPGLTIAHMLDRDFVLEDGLDLAFFVNGQQLTLEEAEACTLRPYDGVGVRIVPADGGGGGGSNPIAAVAMVAVMIAAPYLGGVMVSAGMSMLAAETAIGLAGSVSALTAIAAAGIVVGAGVIVNSVFPQPKPNLGQGIGQNPLDNSPTYGWQAARNPMEPGRPVPILQGEKRNFAPTKLAQYISTSGDRQYLNMLFAVAEGELDWIGDVELGGTPVANLDGVLTEIRLGTATQAVIPWFNDAIAETAVGVKLTTAWHTVTLDGTGVQALGVAINCPNGLGYANDSGGLDTVSVSVAFEYRAYGTTTWLPLGAETVSGAKRSAIMRYWRYAVPTGRFEVRAHVTSQPTGDRYISDIWLDYVHEVVPDDFRLPHTALLAVQAVATDRFSGGAPTVTCSAKRMQAALPDGNGGTVLRPLDNPAWAALELLLHTRYGAAEQAANVDLATFADAADWCSQKKLSGSMYWDTQCTLETACGYLGQFGRFCVDRVGSSIVCISERPALLPDASFLVTSADIRRGTFGLDYPQLEDRADGVEITYFHPERGKQVIFVPGPHFHLITDRPPAVPSITLYPCPSEELAWAAGVYLNRCNQYITRKVSFTLPWKGLGPHLRRGSVIQIAHDQLLNTQSALVLSTTGTTVQLNRPVQLEPGKAYDIVLSHAAEKDDRTGQERVETRPVQPVAQYTVTDTLTLAAPWGCIPGPDSSAAVGEASRTVRWYRILSLGRASDHSVTITALEYHEAVYADEGALPSTQQAASLPAVSGLAASIITVTEDLVAKKLISLSWRGTAMQWKVFVRRVGATADEWRYLGSTPYPTMLARNLEVGHIYRFAVSPTGSVADGQTIDVDFQLNTPSGSIRPVTAKAGGIEVPVYVTVNGEQKQLMGVF